ncbi:YdeI family protein [Cryobacterium sp. TMT4-10]|uniref:YdeI/OmpD-associated family protein n=1 Tax=Cryobacterium sp. TMT4-10 TaxID=1259256 RepID=UPI00106D6164|nr:hypothetical protein [Cryobacterium sp. TMT4-10]TFD17681.1 hypothetical protein E3T42_07105 [Cryobacterium sp. TMT4-10]
MAPPLTDLPVLEPADRQEWRAWLQTHHAESRGVWLAIGKKGNSVTELSYEAAVEEALCFGWIDSVVNRLGGDRYKQLMTPRKRGSAWAPSNRERWGRLVAQGRVAPAGRAAVEAAQADGDGAQRNSPVLLIEAPQVAGID